MLIHINSFVQYPAFDHHNKYLVNSKAPRDEVVLNVNDDQSALWSNNLSKTAKAVANEGGMIEMKKMAIFVLFGNYLSKKLIIQYSSLNLDKAWKG